MKIKKLISIYKRLLPIYRKAYEDDVSYTKLIRLVLNKGLCYAANYRLKENINCLFTKRNSH